MKSPHFHQNGKKKNLRRSECFGLSYLIFIGNSPCFAESCWCPGAVWGSEFDGGSGRN